MKDVKLSDTMQIKKLLEMWHIQKWQLHFLQENSNIVGLDLFCAELFSKENKTHNIIKLIIVLFVTDNVKPCEFLRCSN